MRLSGDALNIDLKVDTGAAYRQMKEDHGKILEALRSQGYAVENVTISMRSKRGSRCAERTFPCKLAIALPLSDRIGR